MSAQSPPPNGAGEGSDDFVHQIAIEVGLLLNVAINSAHPPSYRE